MKRVLVCEDEDSIREFVVLNLKRSGYDVVDVNCGEDAVKAFDATGDDFDVALLDIMMPGMDGFAVCRSLRERSAKIGIIMLSAKSQEMDKVSSLMMGADDYMTKPFSISELVARVDAICRRVSLMDSQKTDKGDEITSGPFVINLKSRVLLKNGKPVDLTQVEYQIMEFFLKNQNTALDRMTILRRIWGENYYGEEKIVDVNIRRIRMKIEDEPSNPKYIITIWGYGYKWSSGE
ncbi:MAG: response regulator transcription factor [Ruminococcus sp.]|nr:response regulator transcription factor [Ruminococcus sp.]